MDDATAVKLDIYDKNGDLLVSCVPADNGLGGDAIKYGSASKVMVEMSDGRAYSGRLILRGGEVLVDELVAVDK